MLTKTSHTQGLNDLHAFVQLAFHQHLANKSSPIFIGDFNVHIGSSKPNELQHELKARRPEDSFWL